jgi:regulator of nonsense transcripts 2
MTPFEMRKSRKHDINRLSFILPNTRRLATPTPGTPKALTPPLSPQLAPQGPSQLLTALLARLPDATNRALIDQAAVDFALLNSKAARKRLVKVGYVTRWQ